MDAYTVRQQLINQILDSCIQLGVLEFVIAPGSRSAPLVTALAQRSELRLRIVVDERAAGYVALGIAQQLRRPVGLICTSGTAALNFAPAVTEAFYQRIPLLVLTADRPPEWIDQQDNQAIHQPRLYEPHVLASFELPTDVAHPDAQWQALRMVTQAIGLATTPVMGPVHINVPLREPIYPATQLPAPQPAVRTIQTLPMAQRLAPAAWDELRTIWRQAERKLIIAGMHPPDSRLVATLQKLANDPTVAVIADVTANLFPGGTPIVHGDMIWGSQDAPTQARLAPDLVVSFGGQVVSKYWKTVLRKNPPKWLWQLWIDDVAPDPFQALTHTIPMEAADFFDGIAFLVPKTQTQAVRATSNYADDWKALEAKAQQKLTQFVETADFGEFKAVAAVMAALPTASHLQLGNSMAIRYANFIGWLPNMGETQVNSNRGTSGIDGTVSTAVGAALTTQKITTLIVGDLAFFYDRNGLWQANLPPNLRIVLLNNHGGGIFDIIEGPNKLDRAVQERFFLTPQPLTARRTAEDHGLDYFFADNEQTLQAALPEFFANRPRTAILEIETQMDTNTQVFAEFRTLVQNLRLGD
ncbi:MAG: 2-succinyl-5-enolpyruvyl-6-hydroxy-3-cyclohexene-1-carboxylic-acid synthase [Caldilineaceae bacterium]